MVVSKVFLNIKNIFIKRIYIENKSILLKNIYPIAFNAR